MDVVLSVDVSIDEAKLHELYTCVNLRMKTLRRLTILKVDDGFASSAIIRSQMILPHFVRVVIQEGPLQENEKAKLTHALTSSAGKTTMSQKLFATA